ncbi:phage morphogenesis protein, partial [Campylobacter ureolyticus]
MGVKITGIEDIQKSLLSLEKKTKNLKPTLRA